MGFLDFVFGKKPQKIENDFFGTMELRKANGDYFFVCYRYFAPVNDRVEISLVGKDLDLSGKETHKQEAFFKNIESDYSQICETLAPHIERAYQEQEEMDGFKITDFHKEFKVNFLRLPTCNETPLDWSIQFDRFDKSSVLDGIAIVLADSKVVDMFLCDVCE